MDGLKSARAIAVHCGGRPRRDGRLRGEAHPKTVLAVEELSRGARRRRTRLAPQSQRSLNYLVLC